MSHAKSSQAAAAESNIVIVDRSEKPVYKDWLVKRLLHPELEMTGPASFDVTKLERELDLSEIRHIHRGTYAYESLRTLGLLESAFGYHDLRALKARGQDFVRRHFVYGPIPAMKTVFEDCMGFLAVQALRFKTEDELEIEEWRVLKPTFRDPVYRISKKDMRSKGKS